MNKSNVLRPEDDGITHINISYMAKTELGKLLNDSSNLLVAHTPFYRNPDRLTFHFTAYGFMAFAITGSKDYHLAGAPIEDIREHLSYSPIRWDRGVTKILRSAYKRRVEREDVWELLKANKLPIVSYNMRLGKAVMRKNDRIALEIYNMISEGLSGRS